MASPAGFGAHRLPPPQDESPQARSTRAEQMLFHALHQRRLVAVVGSGCCVALGYPSWPQMAREIVDLTLDALSTGTAQAPSERRQDLLRFRQRIESSLPDPTLLMFAVGVCQRLLAEHPDGPLVTYFKERFGPRGARTSPTSSPLAALVRLPIQRFVTTNYDGEIEAALSKQHGIPPEAFGIGGTRLAGALPLSFTQAPAHHEQLAVCALAGVEAAQNMVFHCHGRYDEPDTIVASEADYQYWYLSCSRQRTSFLQTLDLLFASNPILFVGYGLQDEDLLRPLRLLSAGRPEAKPLRPLFALLPEASTDAERISHESLYERFGVHVLPLRAASGDERSRRLCERLEQIEAQRLEWRDAWLQKPLVRVPDVRASPPTPYRHYGLDLSGQEVLGHASVQKNMEDLTRAIADGCRVIGLVGPGGTGKSWNALRYLDDQPAIRAVFKGSFFWSSYFADDYLTGLDRIVEYLDPGGGRRESRAARLERCVRRERSLIVLDGFERLLRETGVPGQGKCNDPVTRKLLSIFSAQQSLSTLVLTTRLWPVELESAQLGASADGVRRIALNALQTEDLEQVEPFSWLERDDVSALCALLSGHAYALVLAGRYVQRGGRTQAASRLLRLRRELAAETPDRRVTAMIRRVVDDLDDASHGLARAFLQRLAVFMSPVTQPTVALCDELARASILSLPARVPSVDALTDLLRDTRLLFRIQPGTSERGPESVTIHPTVRGYVFQVIHRAERDALPNFTLAGFTSGSAAVHPGSRQSGDTVRALFERILASAEEAWQSGREAEARQLCRSLLGLVRSRMEANTTPRWLSFGQYVGFGIRLIDLAKRVSPGLWRHRGRHERALIEHPDAPLYADELAFIYNDLGLAYCAEGYMLDALDVWQEGYDINQVLEGDTPVPLYSLQSQLHLAHTFLELGHLPTALRYLGETEATNHKVEDKDYAARIDGYRGVIAHLRAQLGEAEAYYERALTALRELGGNHRAQSVFLRHRAALARELNRPDKAHEYVQAARACAELGQFPDLVAYARITHGHVLQRQGLHEQACLELSVGLAEARRLGIRRMEVEALSNLARLALALGDTETAIGRAQEALSIANELGLGLRRTHGLVLLGRAHVKGGNFDLGASYLEHARRLGERQDYWLRVHEADAELQRIGRPTAATHGGPQ